MPRPQLVSIDPAKLAAELARSGQKQWLLAQQIGVHPRTLSRWLLGRVKRLDRDSLSRLAKVLGCTEQRLQANVGASAPGPSARAAAARAVSESDILALLSPSGNWPLAEKLVLGLLEPELEPAQRGRLLNMLSIAYWRQGRFKPARMQAEEALAIGLDAGEPAIAVKARFNLATLDSFQGRFAEARLGFEKCVEKPEDFASERDFGSALANLSMAYRDLGSFEEALATQSRAAAIFRRIRARFNLAISFAQYYTILAEMGRYTEALRFTLKGRKIGLSIEDVFKPRQMAICQAQALALLGKAEPARQLLQQELPWLPTGGRADPELHLAAARVLRLGGDLLGAGRLLEAGRADAGRLPLVRGLWLLEQARLALARGDEAEERQWRAKANRLFRRYGLDERMAKTTVTEYGADGVQTSS